MLLVVAILPIFLPCKQTNNKTATAASVEDSIGTKTDIIGVNPSTYSGATIEHVTPFDEKTEQMMEGYSITPNADKYGQISGISLSVNEFQPAITKSIYMWLYLIDSDAFGLNFSVSDSVGNACSWSFSDGEVRAFDFGWTLIELKFDDCEPSALNTNVYEHTYNSLYISYKVDDSINVEDYVSETNDRLSIYHVYLARKYQYNLYSGKVDANEKAYGKFSSDFIGQNKVFRKDEIVLTNYKTVFEYLIVGKIDLLKLQSQSQILSNFLWEIEVFEPDGSSIKLDYGDTFMFSNQGHYTINFKLYIKTKLLNKPIDISTELIMNESKNVFCDEMALGSFVAGPNYSMYENDILQVKFKLTEGIDISGELKIEVSNNNVVIESQYEEDGVYYIKLKGVTKGSTNLTISANAKGAYGTVVKSYTSETKIDVEEIDESDKQSLTLLWIAFGGFCAFFAGFLINSLVKARKNDVK